MLSSHNHTLPRPCCPRPCPSSAVGVDAVVFLSDPSHQNFGRKGEESQDVTERLGLTVGQDLDPVRSLEGQQEAVRRPQASQPPMVGYHRSERIFFSENNDMDG